IILLVVVGPERLPGLARQAGQMLVRVRNWVQKSPDAALVMRARQELEQELATLKTSLLEVQNVRDEVLGAAKQIEETVSELTWAKLDVGSLLKAPSASSNGQPTPSSASSGAPIDLAGDPEHQIAPPASLGEAAQEAQPDETSVPLPQPTTVQALNGAD